MAPQFTTADVRTYYDRNTPAFIRLGQGGGAIHRAVWGPGVTDRDAAFQYVHRLIAARIRTVTPPSGVAHVLDLGCGVGATLCELARHQPLRGTGVTISGVQARLAAERIAELGLADRVSCYEADYTALPPSITDVDLAYAIESFVHGPSPAAFFEQAARVTRPGGLLIVCDDVRHPAQDVRADAVVTRFMRGWHVNSLETVDSLRRTAAAAGFAQEERIDLTPYLELRRPRDKAIDIVSRALGWSGWKRLAPLIGGAALQEGLQRGWIAYEFIVFRRA